MICHHWVSVICPFPDGLHVRRRLAWKLLSTEINPFIWNTTHRWLPFKRRVLDVDGVLGGNTSRRQYEYFYGKDAFHKKHQCLTILTIVVSLQPYFLLHVPFFCGFLCIGLQSHQFLQKDLYN